MTDRDIKLKIEDILSSIKNYKIILSQDYSNKITEEYDLDSLGFMQFIQMLENEFHIEFDSDATYEELNKLGYLITEIKQHAAPGII